MREGAAQQCNEPDEVHPDGQGPSQVIPVLGEGLKGEAMHQITTTVKREFFAQVVEGSKRIEYRELKPYWSKRLDGVKPPFELRLRNRMRRPTPEVIVLIDRVRKSVVDRQYQLPIARVPKTAHWDKRRQVPR
jgi:hypothetical protein